jgi:hypothetical protein
MDFAFFTNQMDKQAETIHSLTLGVSDEQARWKPDPQTINPTGWVSEHRYNQCDLEQSMDNFLNERTTGVAGLAAGIGCTGLAGLRHGTLWEDMRRRHVMRLDTTKLVVIDACGTHIGLTPPYACGPKGKRGFNLAQDRDVELAT